MDVGIEIRTIDQMNVLTLHRPILLAKVSPGNGYLTSVCCPLSIKAQLHSHLSTQLMPYYRLTLMSL